MTRGRVGAARCAAGRFGAARCAAGIVALSAGFASAMQALTALLS